MTAPGDIPIPYRIIALLQERNRLFAYPLGRLATEIRAIGFRCNGCGACCTRAINGHIFLLDRDMAEAKKIDPASCEPAPDPEFCDQNGILYVSGYALRVKDDEAGSCWFLEDGKCRIYDSRFSGCRIYPYMLRRGADTAGNVIWLKFARKNKHGQRGQALSLEECVALAREIKEYENAYLTQQISFLETIHEYFIVHNLRHDPEIYKDRIQRSRQEGPVEIKVFHAGELVEYRISKLETSPNP
jgi:uncharacterized protein